VLGVAGPDEEVVAGLELGGQLEKPRRVAVGEHLRLHALGRRGMGDRLAVLVGAGEEEDRLAALPVVAGHDVGGDGRVGVAEVRRRVDVVDRCRYVEAAGAHWR